MSDRRADKDKVIERLQRELNELRSQLQTDELTGLLNRRGLMTYLSSIAKEVSYQLENTEKRRSVVIQSLSLVFMDIDHFKKINDTFGHDGGDTVLRKVAEIIGDFVRGIDIIGRLGGEEMVIGLVGASSQNASKIADRLREQIAETEFLYKGKKISVTASFGISTLRPGQTLPELIVEADKAMYQAKASGRNKVVVFKKVVRNG